MVQTLIAYGWVALAGGLACALFSLLAWLVPSARWLHLPPPRTRSVAWTGLDVLAIFLLWLFIPMVVHTLLFSLGVLETVYPKEATELAETRRNLLVLVASGPLVVLAALGYLLHVRQVPAYQLGLNGGGWVAAILSGYAAWLFLTPPIEGLHQLISSWTDPRTHDLARLLMQGVSNAELLLIFLAAAGVAAVLEEVLFRGVLLPWQVQTRPSREATIGFCAAAVSFLPSLKEGGLVPGPPLFVFVMLPGFVLWPLLARHIRVLRHEPMAALWGNGLLFGAMHANAWPAPIPLLVLGCALAWLRLRTQSLLAPIVFHGLFNAVAVLEAIHSQP